MTDLIRLHWDEIHAIPDVEGQLRRTVELNVQEQASGAQCVVAASLLSFAGAGVVAQGAWCFSAILEFLCSTPLSFARSLFSSLSLHHSLHLALTTHPPPPPVDFALSPACITSDPPFTYAYNATVPCRLQCVNVLKTTIVQRQHAKTPGFPRVHPVVLDVATGRLKEFPVATLSGTVAEAYTLYVPCSVRVCVWQREEIWQRNANTQCLHAAATPSRGPSEISNFPIAINQKIRSCVLLKHKLGC